jgi:OOP family OmpA-OmpF porin
MSTRRVVGFAVAVVLGCAFSGLAAAQEVNLLGLGAGALPVVEPPSYGGWPAVNLLDDAPSSGWACEEGGIANNVFVFELPAAATFTAFEFDTAGIDTEASGAKDVLVEVSPTSASSGFQTVLRASLADRADRQRLPAQARVEGRFVRLVIGNNHGDASWTELMSFRGYGPPPAGAETVTELSGTYATDYGAFHLRQQGSSLVGCYEASEGVFEGAVEGRVVRLTWHEGGTSSGPAVFVFAPDGHSFRGHWWHDTDHGRAPDGDWNGRKISAEVGGCPHWSGSVSGELHKELAGSGRARLYGILFDTDLATIRRESVATLDEVVALLAGEPSWQISIEGHTDATGAAAHNQALSEQRAAAVREYLISKGVAAERLTAVGFGASRPVADNETELGRARNRRVELVRR